MAHTYEELKKKTVAELREIAAGIEHEAVKGYTQLNKEHLLAALCKALGLDMHEHHRAFGVDKTAIKHEIHALRQQRDRALDTHDHKQVKLVRRKMHELKHTLRKHAV